MRKRIGRLSRKGEPKRLSWRLRLAYPYEVVEEKQDLVQIEDVSNQPAFEVSVNQAYICLIKKEDGKLFFVQTKCLNSYQLEDVVEKIRSSLCETDSIKYFLASDRASAISSVFETLNLKECRRRLESSSQTFSVQVIPSDFRLRVTKTNDLPPPGKLVFEDTPFSKERSAK